MMQDTISVAKQLDNKRLNFVPLPVAFVEVVFGMPSRDCRGYGICKVDVLDEYTFIDRLNNLAPILNKALCTLHTLDPDTVLLQVRKSSLDEYTFRKQFGRGCFEVCETFKLNLSEVCYLPTDFRRIEILPGKYELSFSRKDIFITMKIRMV